MTLTIECLLNDTTSDSFQAFSDYLKQQYSTENLFFWLAVEQYRRDYTAIMADNRDDDIKKSFSKLAQQCMAIVDTHVQSNSCLEINIPCDMRHSILNKVLEDGNEICDYHPDLFTPASEAVLELMRSNSFLPWLGQWDPSMLPTPPLSDAHFFSSSSSSSLSTSNRIYPHRASSSLSSLTSSFSSPDGWNIVSSSSPRLSISSFRSTNDTILPLSSSSQQTQLNHQHQQQKNHHHQPQRRVGGLSYQTMLKRMKDCFVNVSSRTQNPIRRSSLTWPSTSNKHHDSF